MEEAKFRIKHTYNVGCIEVGLKVSGSGTSFLFVFLFVSGCGI